MNDREFRNDLIAYIPPLRAFAISLTGKVDRADDLVQETLLKAWANRESFEPGTKLKAWLFTILRNEFYTVFRKRKREVEDADGIIATNTTISRDTVESPLAKEEGGLSGAALTAMSTRIIARIHEHTGGTIPIVGVGGIMGPEDAKAKLDAGAALIQIYTGMIYEGPGLVKRILRAL